MMHGTHVSCGVFFFTYFIHSIISLSIAKCLVGEVQPLIGGKLRGGSFPPYNMKTPPSVAGGMGPSIIMVLYAQENDHFFQTKHACDLQTLTLMWVWLWVYHIPSI